MKCPKCHSNNPDTKQFCGDCGTQLPSSKDIDVTKTLETPVEQLATGSSFAGRYQIIEELGKGGMGTVYKAYDQEINEEVAIKLLKTEIARDKKTIERFRNELKIARSVSHKHVCRMYDIGREEKKYFITMEYVSGKDLKSLIRERKKIPENEALRVAQQICEGLEGAHELGIVHRDLKPQNIMIDKKGDAKIMDFGIARSVEAPGVTQTGVIIGTPDYMSPEQTEGEEADNRSDIYSLGVILYEMVTGCVPFKGDTALSVALKHKAQLPKDPRKLNPKISENLSRLILLCMEKERNRRYRAAEDLLADLRNIEEGFPLGTKVQPRRETFIQIMIRKRLLIHVAIVFTIIIAVILIWRFMLTNTSGMNSLAVLPFEDLSPGKDQEYLATGIPETLINALSRIDGLKVPGKTSSFYFKGEQDINKIGQRLGVDTFLEGSIQVSGGILRIMVRLINIDNGFQIWSEEYQKSMDDVFAIQDDIAQSVVRALKVKFKPEKEGQLIRTITENTEAYNFYLQGLFFMRGYTEEDYYQAIEFFEKAVKEDQSFAQAYVGIAQSYMSLSYLAVRPTSELMTKAETAAREALILDESLAEAHCALGNILAVYRWEWEKAEKEFKHAILLNPGSASIRKGYSYFLFKVGRREEALSQIKEALEKDPLSLEIKINLGKYMTELGKHDEAIAYLLNILEENPKATMALWWLAVAYLEAEKFEKGIQALQEQINLMEQENVSDEISMLAYAYAKWGKKGKAEEYLKELISYSKEYYTSPTRFAVIYVALGNHDEAFRWLNQAYIQNDIRVTAISQSWSWYDPIRSDPRFKEMLKKIGLDK